MICPCTSKRPSLKRVIFGLPIPRFCCFFLFHFSSLDSFFSQLIASHGKRIHNVVPRNFPYFQVEWNREREAHDQPLQQSDGLPTAIGGYVHVIDDDKNFPPGFARQVIGGMMDMDQSQLRAKPQPQPRDKQLQRVAKFKSLFKNYDWTSLE